MTDRPDELSRLSPAATHTRRAGVFLLLTLIIVSPWAFGSVDPSAALLLSFGILSLCGLWAAHCLVTRRFVYTTDAIAGCLLGLVVLTSLQLVPLPKSVAGLLSPHAVRLHEVLIPQQPELLPGESEAEVAGRGSWLRLSLAPAATENLLTRFLAAFLVYAAARHFVAPVVSLRRLAWVGFALGVSLSALGLAQALTGPRHLIYWRFERFGQAFGPFGNKNHFAFQLYPLIGLSTGLLLVEVRKSGAGRSPAVFSLVAGLSLMVAAVLLSGSRGAVLAGFTALAVTGLVARTPGESRRRPKRVTFALAMAIAVLAVGLVVGFGWRAVVDRLATLGTTEADNRSEDWASVWPLVRMFPLVGVGGGAVIHAEHLVRTRPELGYQFNTMDNEYYEALIEGGVPRLALTLGLAVAAVSAAVVAYRQTRSPLLLGAVFGLTGIAVHSVGDFGLHMPSVALLAAVVAACAAHARHGLASAVVVRGAAAVAVSVTLVAVAALVVLADWRVYRTERLRDGAQKVLASDSPERFRLAAEYLEAATRVRPNDPAAWSELATVRLLAAPGSEQFTAGLRAARRARQALPLAEQPHLILGSYADRFVRSEPPEVHMARAKLVAGYDPGVWYTGGVVAAERGDWPTACADWRESLRRSPRYLAPIVSRCAGRLSPPEILASVLLDDPALGFAATPLVFPRPDSPGRGEWLSTLAQRWSVVEPATLSGYRNWAEAARAIDSAAEERVWRRAVERFPGEVEPRDGLAALLEAEERYADAVPVLEWLVSRLPDDRAYHDRLAAARHALRLKAEIDGP